MTSFARTRRSTDRGVARRSTLGSASIATASLSGRYLTLAPRGLGLGRLCSDQYSAEIVEVASQDAQGQVTLKAYLASVSAAFQPVTGLQGPNSRFDTWMFVATVKVERNVLATFAIQAPLA